eukprot:EST45469.1 Hypothetical protein SS50377_14623 [Spironucleus salmonicida]
MQLPILSIKRLRPHQISARNHGQLLVENDKSQFISPFPKQPRQQFTTIHSTLFKEPSSTNINPSKSYQSELKVKDTVKINYVDEFYKNLALAQIHANNNIMRDNIMTRLQQSKSFSNLQPQRKRNSIIVNDSTYWFSNKIQ